MQFYLLKFEIRTTTLDTNSSSIINLKKNEKRIHTGNLHYILFILFTISLKCIEKVNFLECINVLQKNPIQIFQK